MSTFREAVEFQVKEAIKEVTGFPNITAGEKSLAPLLVDRIMEAYKAKVEEMPTESYEACKSYLLEEGK